MTRLLSMAPCRIPAREQSSPSAPRRGTVLSGTEQPARRTASEFRVRAGVGRGRAQVAQHLGEQRLRREALGEGDLNPAHAHAHLGTELQQPGTDGGALGGVQLGVLQAEAAQGAEQHVGEGAEVQPQLVGVQVVGAQAVGEQAELLRAR